MQPASAVKLLVLSGPLCAGKTTLSGQLAGAGARVVSARAILTASHPGLTRQGLQEAGAEMERRTRGAWLADAVGQLDRDDPLTVVDSVRTAAQAQALHALSVESLHVHLTASLEERRQRYENRLDPVDAQQSFDTALAGELEGPISELEALADASIETDGRRPEDVAAEAMRRVGWTPYRS